MSLPSPVARQREVVSLSPSGHTVVLGTAGSGKTTMAILRARYLSDPELPEAGPTLLLTFNKALVSYIKSLAKAELANVTVENFHKFARGYLSANGLLGYGQVIDGSAKDKALAAAISNVRQKYKPNVFFDRSAAYFLSELSWLAQHGVVSSDDYEASERIGRAAAKMEGKYRKVMWEIREAYVAERASAGFLYDWDDLASAARTQLALDINQRRYRHIVIDEGQDFSPEMLRCLAAAIPQNGSLTFFGDVAQQIYGHRMSWRSAGLRPPKVWEFSENYRNTAEIARLGLALAAQPFYAGLPDMVQPKAPVAAGAKPTKVIFSDDAAQLAFVVEQATRAALTQSVAVLARTNRQVRTLRQSLPSSAVELRDADGEWSGEPTLYFGTYHSAKGLEFDTVILPWASDDKLPDPIDVANLGIGEAEAGDGRLLYVGITRARTALLITYVEPVTHLLPTDPSLYVERRR